MILNRNGWSLKEMIILSSILLAFLLVAIFFIVRLYNGLNQNGVIDTPVTNKNYTYGEIEENLLEAGLDYYNEFFGDGESVTISFDKLKKNNYITNDKLKATGESKICTGYVEVKDNGSKSYIKCSHYTTKGYKE